MPPKNALTRKSQKFLTVEIDGKEYNIPTINSMKVKEVRHFMKMKKMPEEDQYEYMCDFFAQYLGQELVDDMLNEDIQELMEMWKEAGEKTRKSDDPLPDPTLGES